MGLFSLLPILGIALVIARKFGSSYSSALLHSIAIIVLLLYVGGFMHILWWVALAIHVAGVGLLAREAWLRGRGNQQLEVSTPIVVLSVATLLFTMIHGNDLYLYYDEYSHWGVYIREMLAIDGFWGADTNSMHPRYPPAAPLWQYYFNFLVEPSEGTIYVAQFVLFLTPFLVLFEKIEWRRTYAANIGWIALLLALGLLLASNFTRGINSIYVDHIIGAWFVGTVLCFAFDKPSPRRALIFLLPLTLLALIKPASAAFALAASGIIGLLLFYRSLEQKRRVLPSVAIGFSAVVLAAFTILSALQLWEWRLDRIGAPADREAVNEIVSGVADRDGAIASDQDAEKTRRFLEIFVGQQLSNDAVSRGFNAFSYNIRGLYTEPFRLSTLGFMVAYVLWWVVLLTLALRGRDRRSWGLIAAGTGLTAVVYICAVYLTYRFAMGEAGLRMSSYMRYVHTIVPPLVVVSIAPLLPAFRNSELQPSLQVGDRRLTLPAMLMTVACVALYVFETPYLRPVFQSNLVVPLRQELEPTVATIRDVVQSSSVWVYLPNDRPNGFIGQVIQYLFSPTSAVVEREPAFLNQNSLAVLSAWSEFGYVWIAGDLEPAVAERFVQISGQELRGRLFEVSVSGDGATQLSPVATGG
jgi:hypothetical protein